MKAKLVLLTGWSIGAVLVVSGCNGAGQSSSPTTLLTSIEAAASPNPTGRVPPGSTAPPTTALSLTPIGCTNPPAALSAIVALDPADRLACFGSASLIFEATISKPILDCGIGPRIEPTWFCLPGVFLDVPGASPESTSMPLDVYWNPSSGLTPASFPALATVRITGHFDDPAAGSCQISSAQPGSSPEPPTEVVLACRETFVVTSVQ